MLKEKGAKWNKGAKKTKKTTDDEQRKEMSKKKQHKEKATEECSMLTVRKQAERQSSAVRITKVEFSEKEKQIFGSTTK